MRNINSLPFNWFASGQLGFFVVVAVVVVDVVLFWRFVDCVSFGPEKPLWEEVNFVLY